MAQHTYKCIIGKLYDILGKDVMDPMWGEFSPVDASPFELGPALLERAIECDR